MSTFTLCFDCQTPLTIPEALKSVLRQDSDGSVYLNVFFNDRARCTQDGGEPLTAVSSLGCIEDITAEELIRSIIVEDECGHCAINVLANICDVCDELAPQEPL